MTSTVLSREERQDVTSQPSTFWTQAEGAVASGGSSSEGSFDVTRRTSAGISKWHKLRVRPKAEHVMHEVGGPGWRICIDVVRVAVGGVAVRTRE